LISDTQPFIDRHPCERERSHLRRIRDCCTQGSADLGIVVRPDESDNLLADIGTTIVPQRRKYDRTVLCFVRRMDQSHDPFAHLGAGVVLQRRMQDLPILGISLTEQSCRNQPHTGIGIVVQTFENQLRAPRIVEIVNTLQRCDAQFGSRIAQLIGPSEKILLRRRSMTADEVVLESTGAGAGSSLIEAMSITGCSPPDARGLEQRRRGRHSA
jgi:hypothetical protein